MTAKEAITLTENVSKKLAEYIKEKALYGEARIFPICYSTARSLVRGLGTLITSSLALVDDGFLIAQTTCRHDLSVSTRFFIILAVNQEELTSYCCGLRRFCYENHVSYRATNYQLAI